MNNVPIHNKLCLTFQEAAEYSGIGINKLRELAANPSTKIALHIGNRTLIKREFLQKYINSQTQI